MKLVVSLLLAYCRLEILGWSLLGGRYFSLKVRPHISLTIKYQVLTTQGIITTGFGLLCFLIIPTDPQRTRIFKPAERALALARIDADQAVRTNGRKESTTLRLVWRSFNINVCVAQNHTWRTINQLIRR